MGIRIDFIQLYKRERLWSQTNFGGPPSPPFPRILANAKLLVTVLHMTFPFQPPPGFPYQSQPIFLPPYRTAANEINFLSVPCLDLRMLFLPYIPKTCA